jgi:hypothetical protein
MLEDLFRTSKFGRAPTFSNQLAKKAQAQTEEPAQPPARENPRRDTNRDRRKDK